MNKNSIEFSLSTQTWSKFKSSWLKSYTERVNQELEQYLRMFIDHRQEQRLEWLGTAEFTYNNKE